tara:strand:+ start:395 stop:571 length:177 start_codon:yes stop_codon:yes gene_type:complete
MNILTTKEIKIVTQALFDLAEAKDITHVDANKILEKIKSRQKNIFSVNKKYNAVKKAF